MFAFAFPAVALVAVGAVELSAVASHKAHLQEAADAAALNGASQLGVAREGVTERVKAFALAQLAELAEDDKVTAEAELVDDGKGIKVTLKGVRTSFFGNLLPPGGFKLKAQSTAVTMNGAPLCVLASASSKDTLKVGGSSQIRAGACLVHSNKDVTVEGGAKILAAMVEASGAAKGTITPSPSVGAPETADPFASLPTSTSAGCTDNGKVKAERGSTEHVAAGVHCGNLEADDGSILELAPGEHFFRNAELKIKDDSKLVGRDVVLIFDKGAKLSFEDQAVVDLEGRKTGTYAGFLIVTARDHDKDLDIWSDGVDNLLGVIYAPAAKLVVQGKEAVAEDSDWTVVVAKKIELRDQARLTINSNYAGSTVAAPQGVGPNSIGARLQH